jgi:hypothetical protein
MSQTKCKVCGEFKGGKEPDPCLGYLPGIAHACCGHEVKIRAYCCGWPGCKPNEPVLVNDARKDYWEKRGKEAIDYMNSLGARIP